MAPFPSPSGWQGIEEGRKEEKGRGGGGTSSKFREGLGGISSTTSATFFSQLKIKKSSPLSSKGSRRRLGGRREGVGGGREEGEVGGRSCSTTDDCTEIFYRLNIIFPPLVVRASFFLHMLIPRSPRFSSSFRPFQPCAVPSLR